MPDNDFYSQAHLIVAAIRVLEHKNRTGPSVEAICDLLNLSVEQGYRVVNQLRDMDIVKIMTGNYGTRIYIVNHLAIEEIDPDEKADTLEQEIAKFRDNREEIEKKVEEFRATQEQKQKDLFAELEEKFKKGVGKT
ncbi:hypothetical protein QUF76_00990 [Desulfobacterales bacterium HSG16]|nr:hypothetical protein [Desulfobacterales bacterium HSG16]